MVLYEFEMAHEEIREDPSALSVWQFILSKYHPTFLSECQNAINLAKELVENTLNEVMFKADKDRIKKSKNVVRYLTDYLTRKTHGRHINIDECKKIELKIEMLEHDQKFQDLVLTVHHCYMHTFANTQAIKLIENHDSACYATIYCPEK